MKNLKWIEEDQMNFDEVVTGISKIICYSNGEKLSERIINVEDDRIEDHIQRFIKCGYEVKIMHQIII